MSGKRVPVAAALAALLALIPTEPARAQRTLQPVKPWNLDYGETQCIAVREYGSLNNPITFAIRPAPNGETYELLIARQRAGPQFAEELEGSVDFGSGPIKAWLLHFQGKSSRLEIHQYRITAAEMNQARSATSVRLHVKDGPDTKFALANVAQLLGGLEKCTADLKFYWNMDGRETSKIAVPAKGSLRNVFTSADYPYEALSRSQEGTAQFLLLIDEKGKVAGCHVVKASGVPALDAMGCQAIRERAHFTPALDSAGKPIRSMAVSPPVTWRLYG